MKNYILSYILFLSVGLSGAEVVPFRHFSRQEMHNKYTTIERTMYRHKVLRAAVTGLGVAFAAHALYIQLTTPRVTQGVGTETKEVVAPVDPFFTRCVDRTKQLFASLVSYNTVHGIALYGLKMVSMRFAYEYVLSTAFHNYTFDYCVKKYTSYTSVAEQLAEYCALGAECPEDSGYIRIIHQLCERLVEESELIAACMYYSASYEDDVEPGVVAERLEKLERAVDAWVTVVHDALYSIAPDYARCAEQTRALQHTLAREIKTYKALARA